ncbi:MAG TPA: carboxypeptidase regulatory-like domain-containing protein [Prolixibacteraceae bacterium]
MKSMLKVYLLLIAFVMIGLSGYSQVTTSGMNGKITGASNESLPGATVVAVHQPSGSQYGAVTNSEGRFSLQGMRSGGPYSIEVSFVGYNKQVFKAVTLSLGETTALNVSLKEESTDVNEVVVVASKNQVVNAEKNGSSINVDNRQMVLMPTITRSINDVTRLTPQANGNTIGGGNYRQNYITVDGAQFNNAFGIGTNLPGNGSPISLDALDQISVNITPFDVRQSGFTGASVNAITRSGTNEFSGSVYTYMNDEKYKGNHVGDATFTKNPSSYQMQGARLGGPIIKNKLFFFVNYETEKSQIPGPPRVAATTEKPADGVTVARPTATEMDMMSKYLLDNYGYQTGPYQGYSNESPGSKLLARIDWNISKNHKFNIRYSDTRAKSPSIPSTSTSPFSSPYTGTRTAMDAMWYQNSGYYQETNFTSLASELNSTFGHGKFSNTLRYTYSFQDEPRSTEGKTFPFVDILKDGKAFTSFGTELFSYGNLREVKTTTITDDFSMTLGRNHVTIGAQYENNNTKNGFMRFGSSFYVFKSWDDFVNNANPQNFGITFSNTPGYQQAFPSFEFNQYSGYIQDEIAVSSKLKVSAGFRVDLPTYSQPAAEHPIIASLTFGDQKYSTSTLPKSKMLIAPRVGFNYDVMGNGSLIVRGGTGIFTGRVPFVWIVGQVSDAGMIQTTQTYTGTAVPGPFNPDPRAYYPATQPVAGTIVPGTFTIISDDFKMPQSWKSSFAIDAKLPWGIKGSLEGLYNADFNTAFFVNTGLKGGAPMNIAGYPDNRTIYPVKVVDKFYQTQTGGIIPATVGKEAGINPIVLTNEKGGYYYSGTVKLEKSFNRGFYGLIAYTHSEAKNLVDGAGDQASSAWNGNANVNGANSVEKSYTSYVTPDKVIANVSYRFEYLKHMATTVSVFYEGGAPSRFSYVYSSNIVRDGAGSNNLIYVPKDASEITFVDQTVTYKDAAGTSVSVPWTAQAQSDAFFAYVDQDKYLSTRKGKYAERNGAVMPWRNQFDLKAMHEFFINVGGKRNTLQVSLDILNVGNLINKNWGTADFYNQNNILVPANVSSVVAGGTVKPTFKLNPYNNEMLKTTYKDNVGYGSTYSMQLGIRYIFN